MVTYFHEDELTKVKKQKKLCLAVYFIILGVYVLGSAALFTWYLLLPYKAQEITTVKLIEYPFTAVFVMFSFIYLGVPFKRVNKYYKLCRNMVGGIKEKYTGIFLEYDETVQVKDGVDFKSLVFIEWNKYKNDFFERKVLVFNEKPFPEIPEKSNVTYITQGNVLIEYEILS